MNVLSKNHSGELQSLRGLAALTVLFHHCSFYYVYDESVKKYAEIIINAHAAVTVFFVLSGYVLCKSLNKLALTPAKIIVFYIRRVFRIYPAMYIALGLALLYALAFKEQVLPPSVSSWWSATYRSLPNLRDTLVSLTGAKTPLAVPLWTLRIELIASVLLPFLVILANRARAVTLIAAIMLVIMVFFKDGKYVQTTLLYLSGFVFGAMIVYNLPTLNRFIQPIALAGFALLWFGRLMFDAGFEEDYNNAPSVIVEGVGAMLLLWAIVCRPQTFSVLRQRALIWLGDISYSLYLVHFSILGLIAGLGTERLGLRLMTGSGELATAALMMSTFGVTLVVSYLVYQYIEIPMIAIGKMVAKRAEQHIPTSWSPIKVGVN